MVFTLAWVTRVGRAVVSVVFVCRLGRVAGLASPHDTTRFTSMVFTLGGMALLDLYGEVFTLPPPPPPPKKSTDESTKHALLCVLARLASTKCHICGILRTPKM